MKDEIRNKLRIMLEAVDVSSITDIKVFDFDGTLVDTPLADTGKSKWKEKTGNDYPAQGWWGRPESLDTNVYEMPIIPMVAAAYKKYVNQPNTLLVMMTGRIPRLSKQVELILASHDYKFDEYIYNNGGSTLDSKIKSLEQLLIKYPNTKTIEMFDDRTEHIPSFKEWGDSKKNIGFSIHLVPSNHH